MSTHDITGVKGGIVERSIVAGSVEVGMGHNVTTNHNQGDNHSGAMSASVGGPTSGTRGLSDVTEEDIVGLLREKNLAKYIPLFQEHRIDGNLLFQLTDGELKDLGIGESFERKKILNLKKCLPK